MCINFVVGFLIFLLVCDKIYINTLDVNLSLTLGVISAVVYWIISAVVRYKYYDK